MRQTSSLITADKKSEMKKAFLPLKAKWGRTGKRSQLGVIAELGGQGNSESQLHLGDLG